MNAGFGMMNPFLMQMTKAIASGFGQSFSAGHGHGAKHSSHFNKKSESDVSSSKPNQ